MLTDVFHLVSDVDRSVSRKIYCFFRPFKNCHGQVFSRSKKCFSTASHPDEALPVFTLFLTAGVAACRRRASRAGRHRPVCWLELATRQVHEDAPRSAQLAAALGTSSAGAHHEITTTSRRHPLAAPGLMATRGSHRPTAHTRGVRLHQDALCRPSRPGRCTR